MLWLRWAPSLGGREAPGGARPGAMPAPLPPRAAGPYAGCCPTSGRTGGGLPLPPAAARSGPLPHQSWLTRADGAGSVVAVSSGRRLLPPGAPTTHGSVTVAAAAAAAARSRAVTQPAVVVVESPTKAKKIQGFLGDNYKVLASYGHVRDLPSREGSVRPEEDFALDWQLLPAAGPRLEEIAAAAEGAPLLLLATDPDREGEAISWHIEQELRRRGVLPRVGAVQRITFTEITRAAITSAMRGGRQVSQPLVDAYLARRALDYLVGFNLSPVLWRKLPGAKSAGRVQSVALRLVCEREAALERFTPTPYWSITAHLSSPPSSPASSPASSSSAPGFTARLTSVEGGRLGPTDIRSREAAEELTARIQSGPVVVARVTRRQVQRHPAAPFTTASLQQEASRRLGFGAAKTMRVAQQLYEGAGTGEGLITYMRTDGVALSAEAVEELRRTNAAMYGKDAVPPQPRQYKGRTKNAQEAHEAIRPTRPAVITPSSLPASLEPDQRALYELIWRRAAASQMSSAVYDTVSVEFSADGGSLGLRCSGTQLRQPGFLRAYSDLAAAEADEGQGEQGRGAGGAESEDEAALALGADNGGAAAEQLLSLPVGTSLTPGSVLPCQHWTRPPPRYTEASLVRALEERGIGRPSTYAPIMSLLQDRGYVAREGRALLPTSLGRVLTSFLEHYFPKYVDYDFTSDMEGQLDDVAAGRAAWRAVLSTFWTPFNAAVASMGAIRTTEVYDMLDSTLENYFFRPAGGGTLALPPAASTSPPLLASLSPSPSPSPSPSLSTSSPPADTAPAAAAVAAAAAAADPRLCPKCGRGRLVLKPSRYGGFIGCSLFSDPDVGCDFARPLLKMEGGGEAGPASDSDNDGGGGFGATPGNATERLLGSHPETGEPVWVRLGPYGLYVQLGDAPPKAAKVSKAKAKAPRGRKSKKAAAEGAEGGEAAAEAAEAEAPQPPKPKPKRAAIPKAKGVTLQTVTLEGALALLALPRTLGPHPEDGQPVVANTGPFGPYVAHNGVSVSLGRAASPQTVDLDTALRLLAAKRARQAARVARGLPPSSPRRGGRRAGGAPARDAAAKDKDKGKAKPEAQAKAKAKAKVTTTGRGGAQSKAGTAPTAARSAYTTFLRQRWQEIKDTEGGQVPYSQAVSRIAAEWRALGADGQRRFVGEAAAAAAAAGPVEPGSAGTAPAGAAATARGSRTRPAARAGVKSATARKSTAAAESSTPTSASRSAAPAMVATATAAAASGSRPNPYIRFCQARRPALRAAHPGAGLGEISQMLGAEWGALSDAQKDAYR